MLSSLIESRWRTLRRPADAARPRRRGDRMRRREFIAMLGGAAAAWPLAARAQERGRVQRVGVFMAVNADEQGRARVAALTERLREFGWVEGATFGSTCAGLVARPDAPASTP